MENTIESPELLRHRIPQDYFGCVEIAEIQGYLCCVGPLRKAGHQFGSVACCIDYAGDIDLPWR
jgi:hypothetical protein